MIESLGVLVQFEHQLQQPALAVGVVCQFGRHVPVALVDDRPEILLGELQVLLVMPFPDFPLERRYATSSSAARSAPRKE